MSTAEIVTLSTSIPAILAAITALIYAVKGKNTATAAAALAVHTNYAIADHITKTHDAFPLQPPDSQEPPL